MTDENRMYGFEILQKLYHDEIQKKEDVIILFVHWYLTKIGFKCLGLGNETVFNASEKGSELLPKEWNMQGRYTLRYVRNKTLYVLSGVKSDADLLLNFLNFASESISNMQLSIEETITTLHGSIETIMPSYQTVMCNLQKDFVGPIYQVDKTIQVDRQSENSSTLRTFVDRREPLIESPPHGIPPAYDPRRIGAADLYPGGQGGGMIFDPFSNHPDRRLPSGLGVPGRLPPGAIPPGARFDPFGPPDLDPPRRPFSRRPDDDHLPPPGYFGDMFM